MSVPTTAHAYRVALEELIADRSDSILDFDTQHVSGSIEALPEILRLTGITRPFVAVDAQALRASGLETRIHELLAPYEPVIFDRISPNPRSEDAAGAAELASRAHVDGVIAIGGGSCCDIAKIVSLALHTPSLAHRLARGECADRAMPAPLVAIPTTSGTGSEATHFAAIYVGGQKVSVAHPALRPLGVVLDEQFHLAMPRYVAACSGLDALGQAIESTWAVGSTDASLGYARMAGPLAAEHLAPSVLTGSPDSRRAMMLASHLAGKAINFSKTTAAHALSYQFTQELGFAHGHAVALTLGQIAEWNAGVTESDCVDPRGSAWVRSRVAEACEYFGCSPETLRPRLASLLESFQLPPAIHEIRIAPGILERFASRVDPVRLGNNPRRLDEASALACLRSRGPLWAMA